MKYGKLNQIWTEKSNESKIITFYEAVFGKFGNDKSIGLQLKP